MASFAVSCPAPSVASAARQGPAPRRPRPQPGPEIAQAPSPTASTAPGRPLTYCRHKIFGRGKIIASLDGGKVRVNFPNFGPKVILADYLEMEDAP